MKRIIALLGALVGMAAVPAHAEILDVNLGQNSVRAALAGPLSHFITDMRGQYDVGVVIRPKASDDLLQAHLGFLITGDVGAKVLDVAGGLGIRGVYVGRDGDSGGAVAVGGQLEARMPDFNRVGVSGYGYYAPSATSLGEVSRYLEYGGAVDYQVVRDAAVYVGWRNISYDIGNVGDVVADVGWRAGVRLTF
jgi:hypothetical protein